ncbi:MAG: hypothetical protein EOP54_09515 [Sphingobacteriales bacterium]|nr:MAG: hypothetical protein EOP54_09515 [Sphingobacteriales bacterium]
MIRKTTYYLALAISFIILMNSCSEKKAYPVGKLQGSNAILVNDDISKAKKYFQFVLNNAKIETALTDFSILQKEDLETRESYYMLIGTGNGGRLKIALRLFPDENEQLGITSESLKMPSILCQSDCAEGCVPERKNGTWACSADCKSECRKTETISYEENNYTTPIQAFLEKY